MKVSISLSSGFSFQVRLQPRTRLKSSFQSRYRAASHFRTDRPKPRNAPNRFNLVIERLLISGAEHWPDHVQLQFVSISLSSGFSFQDVEKPLEREIETCFNLVIERLLISGASGAPLWGKSRKGFNLVIERLLISGETSSRLTTGWTASFNLVIERLLISGNLTSQALFIIKSNRFNLVIERLLISGDLQTAADAVTAICFNLVIERLLISGDHCIDDRPFLFSKFQSRYRAASHFRIIK